MLDRNERGNVSENIQNFIGDKENTMTSELSASAGIVIQRLSKIYLSENSEEDIAAYLEKLSTCVSSQSDESLQLAWAYVQVRIEEASNSLDLVSFWQNGKLKQRLMPLKLTLALVYAALTDEKQYSDHSDLYSEKLSEQENETIRLKRVTADQSDRLGTLWNCFKDIQKLGDGICHQGIRHEFVLTLNGVYPGVWIIEDFKLFLTDMLFEHVYQQLESIRQTDPQNYLQILLIEISRSKRQKEFKHALKNTKQDLIDKIAAKCIEHGINPAKQTEKINNYVNAINDFELPLGNQKTIHCLKEIMQSSSSADDRGKTLLLVKDWIYTKFQLDKPENEKQLQSFAEANKTYSLFKNFISILPTWNHEQIKPEDISLLQSLLDSYFSDCITEGAPCIASKLLLTQMELFQSACLIYARDARMDWIENFFVHWHKAEDSKLYRLLYTQLSAPLLYEKIELNDSFIQSQFQYDSEVYLTPYMINRVFLHAILVPSSLWTTSFAKIMSEVFNFVSKGFENHENLYQSEKLLMDSYSRPLLKQLNYLINYHTYLQGDKSAVEPKPAKMYVPMPHLVKNLVTLAWMFILLPKSQRKTLLMDLDAEVLKKIIPNWSELKAILKKLVESDRMTLINIIGAETLRTLLKDGYDLESLLKKFPELERIILIHKIGGEALGTIIKDEDELKSVLKSLPESDRITLIESIDLEALKTMITDTAKLNSLLSEFAELDRINLLDTIGSETLQTLIKDRKELKSLLKELAEGDRLSLINTLGLETLKTLSKDGSGLGSILKKLPEFDRMLLINNIGIEALKLLIDNAYELAPILIRLPELNRLPFIDDLGLEYLKTIITDLYKLESILETLPETNRLTLVNDIDALKTFVKDGNDLRLVLKILAEKDRIILINKIGTDALPLIIKTGTLLAKVLDTLAATEHQKLIKSFGLENLKAWFDRAVELDFMFEDLPEATCKEIITVLGAETLKKLIPDGDRLGDLLDGISKKRRGLVIKLLGSEILKTVIKNEEQLWQILTKLKDPDQEVFIATIGFESFQSIDSVKKLVHLLKIIPQDSHLSFIKAMGSETLKTLITDDLELHSVLEKLDESERIILLKFLGLEFLKKLITNEATLTSLLSDLGEFDRITLLKSFGSETLKKIINNGEELESVLSELPEFDRIILIDTIGSEALKTLIKGAMDLSSLLSEFAEFDRLILLNNIDVETLKILIEDGFELKSILKKLPESDRMLLINNIGTDALKLIIKSGFQLTKVLKQLPELNRLLFINDLGRVYLKTIITDGDDLASVLESLPRSERMTLINNIGVEALKIFIKDLDGLMKLFELCPEEDWTTISNLLEIEALEEPLIEELIDKIIEMKNQGSDASKGELAIKIFTKGRENSYQGKLSSYLDVNKLLQLISEHSLGLDQKSKRLIVSLTLKYMNWESHKKELFLLKLIGYINPNRDFLTAIDEGIHVVKLMISSGYTPTKEICEAAILHGDHQIIDFLLQQKNTDFEGARVNLIKSGYTPLMFYAAINNRMKVEHLIAFSEDEDIEKTLITAAKLGRSEIVKILIAANNTRKQKKSNLVVTISEFSQQKTSGPDREIYASTFFRNSQVDMGANIRQTSCFSARQIREINSKINELENEIDSSCFGFFTARKNQKISGLRELLKIAEKPGITISDAIKQVEEDKRFSDLRAGVFSTRTATLLDSLLELPNLRTMQAN
jgi:hypothetical protein